ncbi:MAG: FAD-dependent oxidoreductase [Deltaproteobacteria bacterium]|nr:FAD-dependent oxidoreductase [Deltaproteobacteria bacterium]
MPADVVVIGAGPAGLATAAMLQEDGRRVALIDRASVGGAYARMDPALVMTSPARLVGLPGLRFASDRPYATAAAYHAYLVDYARAHRLVPLAADVSTVERDGRGYRVATTAGEILETDTVIAATGVFDHPVRPAIPGALTVPIVHARDWRVDQVAPGERVLIVGGASSAIEIAEACARAGCAVTLATRRVAIGRATVLGVDPAHALFPLLTHISPRRFCDGRTTVPGVDRGFHALRRRGAITVRSAPVWFDGDRACFAGGASLAVDRVVLATGYHFAAPCLPPDLERTPGGAPRCTDNESRSHPGLFVVGGPCARSAASQYLYGIARDAQALARRIARR